MRFRLRTLLIVLALGSAAIGFYEAQKRSDAEERQTESPPPKLIRPLFTS
jgi:hypothetical protein